MLEPFELHVTEGLNRRYLNALEVDDPRYTRGVDAQRPCVHPGLILSQSNPPKSASHVLPGGMASVQVKGAAEFFKSGRVGGKFLISWKMLEKYAKRQRQYMVFECRVIDESGDEVLRRRMTTILVRDRE